MNNLFKFVAFLAVAYAGYIIWQNHSQKSSAEPASAPDSTTTSASAPAAPALAGTTQLAPANAAPVAPPPTAALAPAPAPQGDLSPGTVCYLLQRISITTDSGITGLNPGTRVTLVRSLGSTMRVTDGTTEFDLQPGQVTTDINVATRLAQSESQRNAAISAGMAARKQELQSQAQQQNQMARESRTSAEKIGTLERLQKQYSDLQNQETSLRAQLAKDLDAYYSYHARVHDAIAGYGTIVTEQQQLSQIVGTENDVRNQMAAIQH